MIKYLYRYKDRDPEYIGLAYISMGSIGIFDYARYTLIRLKTGELITPEIWFDSELGAEEFLEEHGVLTKVA